MPKEEVIVTVDLELNLMVSFLRHSLVLLLLLRTTLVNPKLVS